MRRTVRPLGGALAAAMLLLGVGTSDAAAPTPAVPIQSTGPIPTLPAFMGRPAVPDPVPGVQGAWQNPLMATNPRNSVHNDSWASDNYTTLSGPLGHRLQLLSTAIGRDCITLSFDTSGRLISTCTDLNHGPGLYMLDPRTLATLAFLQLPHIPAPPGADPATNTTGGAYFYLDNRGRVVVAASNSHILVIAVRGSVQISTFLSLPSTTRRHACPPPTGSRRCCRTRTDGCGSWAATRAPLASWTRPRVVASP